jgi:hypothetical protein
MHFRPLSGEQCCAKLNSASGRQKQQMLTAKIFL